MADMKQKIRTWGLLIAFIIGGLAPQFGELQWMLGYNISIMLGIAFIGVDVSRVHISLRHALLVLGTLALAYIPWFILNICGLPVLALSAFFAAIAPVGTAVPVLTGLLDGDVEFSVSAQLLSNLCMALLLPLLVPSVIVSPDAPAFSELFLGVLGKVSTLILVPAAVVALLRFIHPRAKEWEPKLKDYSLYLWIFTLIIMAGRAVMQVRQAPFSAGEMFGVFLVALGLCAASYYLGLLIGHPGHGLECKVALGQKSTIVTIYLALTFAHEYPIVFFAPIFYSVIQNMLNAFMVSRHEKAKARAGLSAQ